MRHKHALLLFLSVGLLTAQMPTALPPATHMLDLPFGKATRYVIAEGWKYNAGERAIHGYETHYGLDFDTPEGTKLYMPIDGYVLQSFQTFTLPRKWEGKDVGFGLGHFVQIFVPSDGGYFMQIGHMKVANKKVPYHEPKPDARGNLTPPANIIGQSPPDLSNYKFMKRGAYLGRVGTSGLTWGYTETPTNRPNLKSWDDPHAHLEVFRRSPQGGKAPRWDPYGWYEESTAYQKGQHTFRGMFRVDKKGSMRFAHR